MIINEEDKINICLNLNLSKESIQETKKILFENGLSIQEFIGHLFLAIQTKDTIAMQFITNAKLAKLTNSQTNSEETVKFKSSSTNAIYNLLEHVSPLKNQK